jgi:chloramphenicol-sensitive protein RarD
MSPPAPPAPPASGLDRRGLWHGVLAYGTWGVIPAFWKLIAEVPALEVLAHRALWGLLVLLVLAHFSGLGAAVRSASRDPRVLRAMAVSAALIAVNWGVFVVAVASGHLLDASLGYFINPLMSVALGTLVLRERLRRLQQIALVLAAAGVALLAWRAGSVPWISLLLASSFALYGLVRKLARVESLVGSTIETALLVPLAVGYLGYLAARGEGALGHAPASTTALLVATGAVTAIPLLLFTSAARRLPLSTIGFLQYLAPTGQFLLAVLAYGEPLARGKLTAFALIWLALVAFSIDLARAARRA